MSAEERESFDRDGFLIVDDPCPPALVDAVLADIEPHYHEAFHPGPEVARDGAVYTRHPGRTERYYWNRVRNAWWVEQSVRAMALAPRVLAIVEELFGRPPLPFQTLNFPIGTEQSEHIDAFIFNSEPPRYMCGVWVALEDVKPDSGELEVFPGTHRLPRVYIHGSGCEKVTDDDWADFGEKIVKRYRRMLDEGGFRSVTYRPKRGTVLVWHENLLHGGSVRKDTSLSRRSIVSHYFADGAIAFYDSTGLPGHME